MVDDRRGELGRGPTPEAGADSDGHIEAGFTFVEVIVAVVILTVGLLGLAGTTTWVVRTSTMAEAQTERSVALRSVIEGIRAQDFDDVTSSSTQVGNFTVRWEIASSNVNYKRLRVITSGPGMSRDGGFGLSTMSSSVVDTFVYEVVAP